jgi:gamma-glutamylputrescine oxidase
MAVQSRHPFTEGSYWIDPPQRLAPLSGAQQCEFAIIGGGFTGLSAALRLIEKGHQPLLLEAEFCGAGASGRNAGHVTPTIGKDIKTCIQLYGEKRGLQLVHFAEQAIREFEAVLARYGIECDYERTGNIIAGVHESQRESLRAGAAAAGKLGIDLRFLDETAMRRRGLPAAFRFGVLEGMGGTIHPGKYVLGLRQAAIHAGARIYENSPVRRIERGRGVVLHTDAGTVRASRVLLASNAYTPPAFGWLKSKIAPIRIHQFVTRPLTGPEMSAVGWYGREGIYTAHEILENFRLTRDNRIVGGSKDFTYAYGSRLAPGYQQASFDLIERAFRERFPMLGHVPIETFWGGWIAMTLDFLPCLGTLGRDRAVSYYTGCNGHGIPQCTLMGSAMADDLLGAGSQWVELFRRRTFPLPPEPLRAGVISLLHAYFTGRDRRIDRDLRRVHGMLR